MKLMQILVPVDFSKFSGYAVDHALFLAEKSGAEITLLHSIVLHHADVEEEANLVELEQLARKKEAETFHLFQEQNEIARKRGVKINSKIVRGFAAADDILRFIHENDFDLVVIGTHGRTGLKKWLFGSVAEKVVRLSPTPVLTLHQPLKKMAFEKILVPVDFSDFSRAAVNTARDIAAEYGARLEFLHVINQDFHPSFYISDVDSLYVLDPRLKERIGEQLRTFVNVPDAGYTVMEGRAHRDIVDFARSSGADLIVMATRGLTGLEHFLIGSTAERVIQLANIPVLTVARLAIEEEVVNLSGHLNT